MPKPPQVVLQFVTRPPAGRNNIPLDPADWPAMRRWTQIYKRVAYQGVPEEEAIADYDQPRGVCQEKTPQGLTCGITAWKPTARVCLGCKKRIAAARCQKYRETIGLREKTCEYPGCNVIFQTAQKRTIYCETHKYGTGLVRAERPKREPNAPKDTQPRPKVLAKSKKPAAKKVVVPAKFREEPPKKAAATVEPYSPTWEKPKPVEIPPGYNVTKAPPISGLRDLFGSGKNAAS